MILLTHYHNIDDPRMFNGLKNCACKIVWILVESTALSYSTVSNYNQELSAKTIGKPIMARGLLIKYQSLALDRGCPVLYADLISSMVTWV